MKNNDIAKLRPLFEERHKLNEAIWNLYENFDGDTAQLREELVGKSAYFPLTGVYLVGVTDVVFNKDTRRFEILATRGYDFWDDENLSYVRCFVRHKFSEEVSLCVLDPYDCDCYDRYEIGDNDDVIEKILRITNETSIDELDAKINESKNNYKYHEVDYDEE